MQPVRLLHDHHTGCGAALLLGESETAERRRWSELECEADNKRVEGTGRGVAFWEAGVGVGGERGERGEGDFR